MKLSIDNGIVTCSLENKNSSFLAACSGVWDGFLNGKLKLYDYISYDGITEDGIIEGNAELVDSVMKIAEKYGIEVSDEVKNYCNILQARVSAIREKERVLEEERERAEKWERLCKHGCGRCKHLKYVIDDSKCEKTGEFLREENRPLNTPKMMYLFNLVAFPSENCPFNNKKQGEINEHLREHCSSAS